MNKQLSNRAISAHTEPLSRQYCVWTLRCCLYRFLVLAVLLFPAHSMAAVLLSDVPVPPGATIEIIGVDAVHNGLSISMAAFDAPQPLEGTVAFYQQAWPDTSSSDIPGMIQSRTPEWLLLSHLSEGYNTVIQLRRSTSQRSTGFVSIMPVAQPGAEPRSPPMHDMQLLSDTQTDDEYSSSQLSVYASQRSVSEFTKQLIDSRMSQDWKLSSRREAGDSQVVLMRARSGQLELVVSRADDGGSLAVLNEITMHD